MAKYELTIQLNLLPINPNTADEALKILNASVPRSQSWQIALERGGMQLLQLINGGVISRSMNVYDVLRFVDLNTGKLFDPMYAMNENHYSIHQVEDLVASAND